MDQGLRNKLRGVVTQCRKLLEDAVAQTLQGQFGVYSGNKGEVHVEDAARMTHLSEEDQAYRKDILDHFEHIKARGSKPKEALDHLIREIAFTHLNRLCAYKLMEARQVWIGGRRFREAVSRGQKSQGFLFYLADYPEEEARFRTGQQDVAYWHFLDWLGDTLSEEIGVLFNPHDPANRLYPPQRVLDEVLALINSEALAGIWAEDEPIGWVYQYFTPKELRDQARKESAAPRHSYELAFRNQFFTPRYVVEFLTDNTLGRIWYEMRKGDTKLKGQCRYMVRRPNEKFLEEGQAAPQDTVKSTNGLSQEELLKQPVHILHRPKKDPRDLKILDPACGSGHFLLYCFDVLQTIYEEAYNDPNLGPALKKDYPTLDDLRREVPGLILTRNLYGIDIDLRATQIAALALWLRCQRAYQEIGLQKDRPKILRSNIVCAEPMPGEKDMLKEFVAELQPKVLGQLVEVVFDRMRLAGEAGSLLKIEEELRGTIVEAMRQWQKGPQEEQLLLFEMREKKPEQQLLFDVSGITDEKFWEVAEKRVLDSLNEYSKQASNGSHFRKRLFAEDAAHGFSFIDVCQKRFDVILMNPPFGLPSAACKAYIFSSYPVTKNDLLAAFVEAGLNLLHESGTLGAITSRTGFYLASFQEWRQEIVLQKATPFVFADFGPDVLDSAMVETAAFCLRKPALQNFRSLFIRLLYHEAKASKLAHAVRQANIGRVTNDVFLVDRSSLETIPGVPFAYWVSNRVRQLFTEFPPFENEEAQRTTRCGLGTTDNFRFLRNHWEVRNTGSKRDWVTYYDGGIFSPIYDEFSLVVWWKDNGKDIKRFIKSKFGSASRKVQGEDYYFKEGFVFPRRTKGLSPKILAQGGIYSNAGQAGFIPRAELPWSIGLLASAACTYLVSLSQGRTGDAAQFEVGLVKRLPWPSAIDESQKASLATHTRRVCDLKREMAGCNEISFLFSIPALVRYRRESLSTSIELVQDRFCEYAMEIQKSVEQIDRLAFDIYGFSEDDRHNVKQQLCKNLSSSVLDEAELSIDDESVHEAQASRDTNDLITSLISYLVGCALGRWDIRFACGKADLPELPDPFSQYPNYPLGMLQLPQGVSSTEPSAGYPLRIARDCILVDDPEHQNDIIRRIRDVLELIWKDRADAIEKEACEILGVKDLRDYFRRPGSGGFWDGHVKRYSKSRRKAPLYWLLQSSRKNYALWIYYHQLDKDILFKALLNYVEPKIRLEESRLEPLRAQRAGAGASGKGVKKLEKDIERQEEFISELRDFEDKLRRVANLHLDPDLNDGVILNIAPLWELVPWKEAKNYWEELLGGKYEWSSIGKQLREKGIVHAHSLPSAAH